VCGFWPSLDLKFLTRLSVVAPSSVLNDLLRRLLERCAKMRMCSFQTVPSLNCFAKHRSLLICVWPVFQSGSWWQLKVKALGISESVVFVCGSEECLESLFTGWSKKWKEPPNEFSTKSVESLDSNLTLPFRIKSDLIGRFLYHLLIRYRHDVAYLCGKSVKPQSINLLIVMFLGPPCRIWVSTFCTAVLNWLVDV